MFALAQRRFPVFICNISVCSTVKASAPSVGKPIRFTGIPVAAGDWGVADDDGVIMLPSQALKRALQAGRARADKEAAMMQALQKGAESLDLLGLSHWREYI